MTSHDSPNDGVYPVHADTSRRACERASTRDGVRDATRRARGSAWKRAWEKYTNAILVNTASNERSVEQNTSSGTNAPEGEVGQRESFGRKREFSGVRMKLRGRGTRAKATATEGPETPANVETALGQSEEVMVPPDDFLCLFDESAREAQLLSNQTRWEDVFAQNAQNEDIGEHFPYVEELKYKVPPSRSVASTSKGRVTKRQSGTRKPAQKFVLPAPLPVPSIVPMYRTPCGKPRSSKYNGVCRHAKSGRYEAHVWLRESRRQVYLGGYLEEEFAAEAFDIIVLKLARIGDRSRTGSRPLKMNFPEARYANLIKLIDSLTLDELIMEVRRHSEGFARGTSGFRGVTRHANSKFEARLGVPQSSHMYLGLFDSAEKAAIAYDTALVQVRGRKASTNFPLHHYNDFIREYEINKVREAASRGKRITFADYR